MSKALADARRSAGGGGGGGGGGGTGGAGTGGATLGVYAQIVNRTIKRNWRFPQMGARESLTATVELHIDKDGRILRYALVRSSGRPNYDASALKAVAETGNLPAPPPGLTTLQLNFKSEELAGR